mmetsp:Transcript_22973/g.55724  ORF Transcript_22973/g.55724 Transcript_22973/m.55724 type:complete len:142 (+) Transcript_22973:361-786(+)
MTLWALKRHVLAVHNRTFRCTACMKTLENKERFFEHMQRHANKSLTIWKCPKCEKVFSRRYGLDVHVLQHRRYRPYQCGCGMSFNDPSNLKRHSKNCRCPRSLVNKLMVGGLIQKSSTSSGSVPLSPPPNVFGIPNNSDNN